MNDLLLTLQQWIDVRLDGEWEHDNGIRISNSDNPGWLVDIFSDKDLIKQEQHVAVPTASARVESIWAGDRIMIHSRFLADSLEFAVTVLSILNGERMDHATLCERLKKLR